MRKYSLCLLVASCSALATAANANTIFEDQDTALISNPSPAGALALGPDGQVGGIGGPVLFTMPFDGLFTLTVQDCCLVGDVYQAFVDGASLGFTCTVPLGGPDLTSGTFYTYLTAGAHTYDVEDQILSYIGFDDPYGGGIVPTGYSPAGLEVSGVASAVPEPSACGLLGLALIGVSVLLRRHLRRA